MDGVHDLGGRQGFGTINVHEDETPFHAAWEGRVWGIVRVMARPADWNSDWFRHCRELIGARPYLERPYYDQWLQTYAAMMVISGVASISELSSGRATLTRTSLSAPVRPEDLRKVSQLVDLYHRDTGATPRHAVGDAVHVRLHGSAGHTRLPLYVRGRVGRIECVRGIHLLPDANAHGDARAEPLYGVSFALSTLWPEATGSVDRVHLDLWESYLA